jgi:hypothetical protein
LLRHPETHDRHRLSELISSLFSVTYACEHLDGPTPGPYTEGEETLTAITPALATAPCTRTGSACTRRTHPPRTADHKGQPRKGDPTNSPWREPRDTDPHEIPSSAVSAAQSAPRPRGQQPGGPPLHKPPQRCPDGERPKAAKRGHAREQVQILAPRPMFSPTYECWLQAGRWADAPSSATRLTSSCRAIAPIPCTAKLLNVLRTTFENCGS